MDYQKIGQQIRKFRKRKGYSQEQLAEIINISTTHMSHIETGSTKLSLPVLVDLANALEVGADDLLTENSFHFKRPEQDDISALLKQCSPTEIKMLTDLLKAAKQAMDKYL